MFTNLFNYIMLTLVMFMSCGIVSYVICMFYVLCKIAIIIEIGKFIYFRYIDNTISVYGIMFINSNINEIIMRLFVRFETLLVLKSSSTSVAYWFIFLDMLFVLLNVIL